MNRLTEERRTMSMCMSVEECQKHNRLWEYEQTGLAPEQVAAMQAELAAYRQAEAEGIEKAFPEHKCGLYVTHNSHKDSYETVQQAIGAGTYDAGNFENGAEIEKCIKTDSVWVIQWYPETPVGFFNVCASTLEKALAMARAATGREG